MIGVIGQYTCTFSVEGNSDFIDNQELKIFEVTEELGNVLPIFNLEFTTYREDLFQTLNENSDIYIDFTGVGNDHIQMPLKILELNAKKEGATKYNFNIKGMYKNVYYNVNPNILITEKLNGVDAIKQIVNDSKAFKTFTNLTNSQNVQGQMNWIQANISDRLFVNDIWLHTYINESFPMIGITAEGEFLLGDLRNIVNNKDPKWYFTNNSTVNNANIIAFNNSFFESFSGFMNQFQAHGRTKVVNDQETGTSYIYAAPTPKPVLGSVPKLIQDEKSFKRPETPGFQCDNVDYYYIQAGLNNISHLAAFDTYKVHLMFSNRLITELKLMDYVNYTDTSLTNVALSNYLTGGGWIVSKKQYLLTNNMLNTVVTLSRESLNFDNY